LPTIILALVEGEASPGPGCTPMMPGLFAVFDGRTVDRVIEQRPGAARYFTGLVVWRPGELAREIAGRLWYVLEAEPALARRNPHGLWEELVSRAQLTGDLRVTRAAPPDIRP
jgi:putative AlgH/UPF0301 family transcriptional regulator